MVDPIKSIVRVEVAVQDRLQRTIETLNDRRMRLAGRLEQVEILTKEKSLHVPIVKLTT
jgi:hypothetical protein